MGFFRSNKARLYSIIALIAILALLIPMVSIGGAATVFAGTVDYYELKVGEETVAVLGTEEDAYGLIEHVRDKYIEDGQNVVDIRMTPAVTVSKVTVPKSEEPAFDANMGKVLNSLLDTSENDNEYVVKEGDTVWDISTVLGMSIDAIQKQNPGLDIDNIAPGDKIVVKSTDSLINVMVEYEVESEVIVPFETIYEEDPTMSSDEEEYVKVEGVKGTKLVKERVVKVNGIIDQVDEISSEIITEPVSRIVVRGTLGQDSEEDAYIFDSEEADEEEEYYEEEYEEESYTETESYSESSESEETYSSASTYSGNGSSVVDYALQFVGNPYVWGGTSLTNGCDCSGFIWRVFNDCGYSISRWPDDDFPHVSASELRPGDITRYGGHYAIYIGNGMEISAVDEEQGIKTHPMYYSRSAFWYGIRVIG